MTPPGHSSGDVISGVRLTRPALRVESLVALIALYCVVFGNGPWWAAVAAGRSLGDPATWLFMGCCFVMLVALHFFVLALPATRWTAKAWLTLIVIGTSFAVYWMRTYSVMLDPSMLRNVVSTDQREARELLTAALALNVVVWAVVPVAFIWWVQLDERPLLRAAGFKVAALVIALVVAVASVLPVSRDFTSLMRNQRELRYLVTPGNFIYSLGRNAMSDAKTANAPKAVVGTDAKRALAVASAKPKVIVFVVGETARAANFSLFGYSRETNPELSKLDILPFSNVKSCCTSTEVSLPCMFSPYGRVDYDDVLARAGVVVKWTDNQSGCKGVCDAAGLEYRKPDKAYAPDLCDNDECLDEVLVRTLKQDLDAVTGDTMVVLHQMGNHGPAYFRRYPPAFRRFTPDCATAELRNCNAAQVVNAYDNAILYTDHVLAEVIRLLASQSERLDTAFLYVSDHGESLGESGMYLHGLPYAIAPELQTHVPMIVWMSAGFAASSHVDVACLRGRTGQAYSHDNLFHSLLGALDVTTSVYQPGRDLFAPCRTGGT
jgi:lipid A ethanolaminephosphotransferase